MSNQHTAVQFDPVADLSMDLPSLLQSTKPSNLRSSLGSVTFCQNVRPICGFAIFAKSQKIAEFSLKTWICNFAENPKERLDVDFEPQPEFLKFVKVQKSKLDANLKTHLSIKLFIPFTCKLTWLVLG